MPWQELFDLGDDVEVEEFWRKKDPVALKATYSTDEVKHAIWKDGSNFLSAFDRFASAEFPNLEGLIREYSAAEIKDRYDLTTGALVEAGINFDRLIELRGGDRMDALRFVATMGAAYEDLVNLGVKSCRQEERIFLRQEFLLGKLEIDALR